MKRILSMVAAVIAVGMSLQTHAFENDWPNYKRYAKANQEVLEAQAKGARKPLAVLMGDSITDGWYRIDQGFFKDHNLLGRGISGQCTTHMLARFQRDVVELRPKYVVILAGINDIAGNAGGTDVENAFKNIVSMVQIAKQNKIKVILASTTLTDRFTWRPDVELVAEQVKWLNNSIKEYAKSNKCKFVDYGGALADEQGLTASKYSNDKVHPNEDGYKVMEELLLKALGIKE